MPSYYALLFLMLLPMVCLSLIRNFTQLPIQTKALYKSTICNVRTPEDRVIKSQAELNALWSRIFDGVFEGAPALVEVNFDIEMVIAVFMGRKNTGGYDIEIQDVKQDSNSRKVYVDVKETYPKGGPVTMAITSPCHVITATKVDEEVVFRHR